MLDIFRVIYFNLAFLLFSDGLITDHYYCDHEHQFSIEKMEKENSARVTWTPEVKLSWDDFQATPHESNGKVAALTCSIITYKYHCEGEELIISVFAEFSKELSWVKPEAKSDYVLKHEQLHFDITELYARILEEELAMRQFVCGEENLVEEVVDDIMSQWEYFQHKYDKETFYSLDESMQLSWNSFIADRLSNYHYSK